MCVHVCVCAHVCTGDLTATVSDPHGSQLIVRIDKSPNKDRQAIEFIPRVEGNKSDLISHVLLLALFLERISSDLLLL